MDISYFLTRAAKLWPDKESVVYGAHRFTYRQTWQRAKRLSAWLRQCGVNRGQVVSILAPNCHQFIEAYFGCAMLGVILNPVNYRLSSREVAAILADASPKAAIVHDQFAGLYEDALEFWSESKTGGDCDANPAAVLISDGARSTSEQSKPTFQFNYEEILSGQNEQILEQGETPHFAPDTVANLYYTSGTTGSAKGVMLTYENVSVHALCTIAELKISDGDTWLHAAPMFHLADAWAVYAITACGGRHVCLPFFKPAEALRLMQEEKISLSNLIPTMLNAMVNDETVNDWSYASLRLILSGGSSISPETVKRISEAFQCEYVQTYGMTETSPYLTLSIPKASMMTKSPSELMKVRSRTGRPFMGAQLKVVREDGTDVECDDTEVGEIIVKGPIVTPGYWKKPAETAQAIRNGWLHTGDLAVIDEDGYVNIVDRKKDMIITGGENVYSTEVEHVLYEHPAVLECAVFGTADPQWGEAVTAAVVLKAKAAASAQDLIEFVRGRIAHYKAPRRIEFLTELPKTGSGKIQKKLLREREPSK
jgi:fatty-acyl-CoA synthase